MKIDLVQVTLNRHKRESSKGFSMWDIYHMSYKMETQKIEKKAEEEAIQSAYELQLAKY